MAVADVQLRIAQIQSMMTTAARQPTLTPTRGVTGATPLAGSPATQFASVLDAAVAQRSPWATPTRGSVSSEFGPRWGRQHEGIDIAAATGTPVQAAAAGVVRKASWYGGYGNTVIIDHGGGVSTLYAHNSALTVRPGDRVEAGQAIANVGSTGDSTGPHLHFEVEVDGKKMDPRTWLAQRGVIV